MSADELRQAAATLRERADHANADDVPWIAEVGAVGTAWINSPGEHHAISMHGWPAAARYIATVHPGVGLALADWLDTEAGVFEYERDYRGVVAIRDDHAVMRLARLINGGAS